MTKSLAKQHDAALSPAYEPTEVNDLGAKCAARCLLSSRLGIVVPSRLEMIGVALLERDDELPGRRR